MNNPSDNHEPQKPSAAAATGVDARTMAADQAVAKQSARRRFLGKGAVAAPAILTLAAQPALGATCYAPSGSLSKNTSGGRNYTGTCTGFSPGRYKTRRTLADWSPVNPSALIGSVFSPVPLYFKKSNGNPMTLLEVIDLTGQADPYMFGFHMVAAYANIKKGKIPANVLDETKLKAIWTAIYTQGYYQVGGQQWKTTAVVDYLKLYEIAP